MMGIDLLAALSTAAQDVARLVVPVSCPGCGLVDVRWCEECAAPWWEPPLRSESAAPRLASDGEPALPVWSVCSLESTAHGMIAAWKDGGRRDLDAFFCNAMGRAIAAIRNALPLSVVVVPAPARPASTRRRGADLPLLLAKAATASARAGGLDARVWECLSIGAGESRRSSARARWRSAHRGVAVRTPPAAGSLVLLVDDVMTTGATLAASSRALAEVGTPAIAAVTLATAVRSGVGRSTGLV